MHQSPGWHLGSSDTDGTIAVSASPGETSHVVGTWRDDDTLQLVSPTPDEVRSLLRALLTGRARRVHRDIPSTPAGSEAEPGAEAEAYAPGRQHQQGRADEHAGHTERAGHTEHARPHLVVDTFPAGIAHELEPLFAELCLHTTLVARYLQRANYPRYRALVGRFDDVLLPYHPDHSEWDDPPPGTWIGPVHRPLRFEGHCDLLVVGHGEPPGWTSLLARAHRIDGPFDTLPRPRAVVALSAGYNLFWELASTGVPCAFRPLPRRYDDQFRRVGRFGTPLLHRADLVAFLQTVSRGPELLDSAP